MPKMIRLFGLHLETIAVFMGLIEVSLLLAILLASGAMLDGLGLSSAPRDHLMTAGLVTLVTATGMISVGLYARENFFHWPESLSRAVVIFPLIGGLMGAAAWLFNQAVPHDLLRRDHYLLGGIGLAVFLPLFLAARRAFVLFVERTGIFTRRVAVLGCGSRAGKIERLSQQDQCLSYRVAGYVRINDQAPEPDPLAGASTVCRRKSSRHADYTVKPGGLSAFCRIHRIKELVIAARERRGMPTADLLECKMAGVHVIDYASFWERESHQIDMSETTPGWLIYSEGFKTSVLRRLIKRASDIVVSLIVLILTFPLLVLTAVLIKLESPGPIFYSQERVGLAGKSFMIFKFRSMRTDAEANGPRWAGKNDDRVTRVGAFIRKVRIDELPQVINVLNGDMSFVGPRPERPVFVAALASKISYYSERHRLKPGITGWAQINYPYGANEEDARMKLRYDLYYVKNGSIFLDVIIMMQTLKVLIWNSGVR